MEEANLLTRVFPDQRLELIEGDLFNKSGQKPRHAYVVQMLTALLVGLFGIRVRVQSSIRLPRPEGEFSEPEPDVVLLHQGASGLNDRHPGPEDIALLIEVADASFTMDREVKYRLYARAGISEYWIVDIPRRRILVCREPAGDEYKSVTIFDADEEVSPLIARECVVSFARLTTE